MAAPTSTMEQTLLTASIPKLTGRNYRMWRELVMLSLKQRKLWSIVSDEGNRETPPATGAKDYGDWSRRSDATQGVILSTLTPEIFSDVIGVKTAPEVWDILKDEYGRLRPAEAMRIRDDLSTLRKDTTESIHQYLSRAKGLMRELMDGGEKIDEGTVVNYVIRGLPTEYKLVTKVLMVNSDESITLSTLKAALLSEEVEVERNAKADEEAKRALQTRFPSNAHEGDGREANKKYEKTRKIKGKCWNCDAPGHMAVDCKKPGREHQDDDRTRKAFMVKQGVVESNPNQWIADSGATHHMCKDRSAFVTFITENDEVEVAGGQKLRSMGHGTIHIDMIVDGVVKPCSLQHVLFVPDLCSNLFSVQQASSRGAETSFKGGSCIIKDATTQEKYGEGYRKNGLYYLKTTMPKDKKSAHLTTKGQKKNDSCLLWHRRLGHANITMMADTADAVNGITLTGDLTEMEKCEDCILTKMTKEPISKSRTGVQEVLDLVVGDTCGPMQVKSVQGSRYFSTLIDVKSRRVWAYVQKTKDEASSNIKSFVTFTENEQKKRLKSLRTDNGGEYTSNELEDWLAAKGILHETIVPENPHQNGIAERYNRTLVGMIRAMLKTSAMPKQYWAEALNCAVYLINRLKPAALDGMVPMEAWTGHRPSVAHLRVFGCLAFARVPESKRRKLDDKAKRCVLLGYASKKKGYRLLDLNTMQVIISKDVTFKEDVFPFKGKEGMQETDAGRSLEDSNNQKKLFFLRTVAGLATTKASWKELNMRNWLMMQLPLMTLKTSTIPMMKKKDLVCGAPVEIESPLIMVLTLLT